MNPYREVAFIALGSNLSDPRRNLLDGIARLEGFSTRPLLRSSLWSTEPVDCPPGSPPFLNAVAGVYVRAGETPETLLVALQLLEREFGRKPKLVLNEARPLDLDIITFGGETRSNSQLTIPHPRAHLRRFVLQPLDEIAPELVLPGQNRTVRELLQDLPDKSEVRRFRE